MSMRMKDVTSNTRQPIFPSFLMAGFECSTHRVPSGRRLDLIKSTRHDQWAHRDYHRLQRFGVKTVREGLRWHLIETQPGQYDFSSMLSVLEAAEECGVLVIWDICHYGWPDDLNIFRPAFVDRLAAFTQAFVEKHVLLTGRAPFIAPINEISFFAWAGGQIGFMNPFKTQRGDDLKRQLALATIVATRTAKSIAPETKIVHTDPLIHVAGDPTSKQAQRQAEAYRVAQFQAMDMITGRMNPELGGHPDYIDVIGVNYYPNNQWMVHKASPGKRNPPHLHRDSPFYRPPRELFAEVSQRYQKPVLIAETGTEGKDRAEWFRYICDEVAAAEAVGTPIEGICWYPILNHPGWTNNRHCHNGLWDYPDRKGHREEDGDLAEEWLRQLERFSSSRLSQAA